MLYTQIGVCVTVCGCGCVKLQKYSDKKPSTCNDVYNYFHISTQHFCILYHKIRVRTFKKTQMKDN